MFEWSVLLIVVPGIPSGTRAPGVEIFDLLTGPWSFTNELETRLHAWIFVEAVDVDFAAEAFPAVIFDECFELSPRARGECLFRSRSRSRLQT